MSGRVGLGAGSRCGGSPIGVRGTGDALHGDG